jgi:hypothetical protein
MTPCKGGEERTVDEVVEVRRVDGGDRVGQLGQMTQIARSLRHRLLGLLSEGIRHPIEQPALDDRLHDAQAFRAQSLVV